MSPTVYLLTGANRGLGLEIARLLASDPANHVIATSRNPSTSADLQNIADGSEGRVTLIKLDQTNLENVQRAFKEVSELEVVKAASGIDVLVLNAGVNTGGTIVASKINYVDLKTNLDTNLWGPIYVTNTFLPLLRSGKGKKIFYVSTAVASSTLNIVVERKGEYGAYGTSKAGANFFFARLHQELEEEKEWTIIPYHPGYIETDMNKGDGAEDRENKPDLSPVQAAEFSVKLVQEKGVADSGKFHHYSGEQIPW